MVQINPLLYAIPVLSRFTPLDSASSGLVVRQSFDPSSLPSACQFPCQVVGSAGSSCNDDLSCMCTSTLGNELQQCLSCLANADPIYQNEAQGDISSWNEICNGSLTLSGGSSSGDTTGWTTGTAVGTTGGTTGVMTVDTTSGTTGGTTSGTTPATATGTSSSGGSGANPLAASGGVGLKTSGSMVVCMVAALVGAFISF
ncbi:hypothetical protein J3R82DRAFT_7564 [Butyriboletus roseoflavus]|nr:hypothetical protein J3R82DRAFT_7564 [Butyriboletus roseoflavus]